MDPIDMLNSRLKGTSLRALAKQLGVSPPYLSDIMHGRRKPGPKVLSALGVEQRVERVVTYRRKR